MMDAEARLSSLRVTQLQQAVQKEEDLVTAHDAALLRNISHDEALRRFLFAITKSNGNLAKVALSCLFRYLTDWSSPVICFYAITKKLS